jgi:hypothetical protein
MLIEPKLMNNIFSHDIIKKLQKDESLNIDHFTRKEQKPGNVQLYLYLT